MKTTRDLLSVQFNSGLHERRPDGAGRLSGSRRIAIRRLPDRVRWTSQCIPFNPPLPYALLLMPQNVLIFLEVLFRI